MTEPTSEGLTRLFAHGQSSLGLFSDEGGQFLAGHAMGSDHKQITLTALNKLWQGDLAHITGTVSKAAEQAARIAGVLTLWRDLDALQVQAGDMADAIDLAQFYLSEASRLASAATVSAEIDRAETLRRWLLESWPEPEITVRDVVQYGPNAMRETPKARGGLGTLEKHGWLAPMELGTVVRGAARKEAWAIVKGAGHVV